MCVYVFSLHASEQLFFSTEGYIFFGEMDLLVLDFSFGKAVIFNEKWKLWPDKMNYCQPNYAQTVFLQEFMGVL